MTTATTTTAPVYLLNGSLHRFTVDEYHRLIEGGFLEEDEPLELLEGYVVQKMPRNPLHDGTIQQVNKRLLRRIPGGWDVRVQSAVTLADSEPEPDLAVVRGDETSFQLSHPGPPDIGLVIEVAESSLQGDRTDKARIYGRAGLTHYWIVNLVDRQVEVFTGPTAVGYAQRQDFAAGADVALVLDGVLIATIPASELLP